MTTNSELRTLDKPATGADLIALDATAVRTSVEIVEQVTAADLSKPTPCAGWTLYGLLAHMTTQHHGFAAAAEGKGELARWRLRTLGADPIATYRASADRVLTAFAADDIATREFPLPELRPELFPAAQAISFHFIDYVVHSWDVASTLGLSVRFDQDLLDVATAVATAVPGGDSRLVPGAAFGPELPWDATSDRPADRQDYRLEDRRGDQQADRREDRRRGQQEDRLDKIVAMLGRSPRWPS